MNRALGITLIVALAVASASLLVALSEKRSDSASLGKFQNRDAAVYLRVQPVQPPYSGGTSNGITFRGDTPISVIGKITAVSDEGILVRSGTTSCFIPKDMIALISFGD